MATLIFDLDGTLLDVRRRHYQVYSDAYHELGVEPLTPSAYWKRRLAGEGTFQIAADLPGALYARFTQMWMECVESRTYLPYGSLFPHVPEVLAALGEEHRLLLVTLRRHRDLLMEEMRSRGMENAFEKVLSPVGEAPRDKAALLMDTYVNGNTWVIGDSEADVDLARNLNARMVALTCGVRSGAFLAHAGATCVLDAVADVPAVISGR